GWASRKNLVVVQFQSAGALLRPGPSTGHAPFLGFFRASLARFFLRVFSPIFRLLQPVAAETLTMDFTPVERLWGLLLTLQTAQQHLFAVRPAKAVLAQPHLPARTSLAIRPEDETTNKPGLAPQTHFGHGLLVRHVRRFLHLPSHNSSLFGNQFEKFSQHAVGQSPDSFAAIDQRRDFDRRAVRRRTGHEAFYPVLLHKF